MYQDSKNNKIEQKIYHVLLYFFYIFVFAAIIWFFYNVNREKNFYIKEKEIEVELGSNYQISLVTKYDEDLTKKNSKPVTWTSSNNRIAVVDDNGVVTALRKGMAEITARSGSGKVATTLIIVNGKSVPVEDFYLDKTDIKMSVGQTIEIVAMVEPSDADDSDIKWRTSNKKVAIVKDGIVVARASGKAVIEARLAGGKTVRCNVTVLEEVQDNSSLDIDKKNIDAKIGDEFVLNPIVYSPNNEITSLSWVSSDESIATVENGLVKIKNSGSVIISLIANNGKIAKCTININDNLLIPDNISLDNSSLELFVGDEVTLNAHLTPENANRSYIAWTSSDPSVATVKDGHIKAKKSGKTVISAIISNGKKAKCTVIVKKGNAEVSYINFNKENIELEIGQTDIIKATVSPTNAANKKLTWTSSDSSVVTVKDGVIEAKKAGVAIIEATSNNGMKSKCVVTVKEGIVSAKTISLNKKTLSMKIGDSYTLNASIKPDNTTNKTIIWSSSNNEVVNVSNGVVKALKEGKATISAITSNGKKETCTVTVSAGYVEVSEINIDKKKVDIEVGSKIKLNALFTPTNASDKNVTWKSSNSNIVTVSNGVIEAKKAGTVTITATSSNGKTATCEVVAKESVVSVNSIKLNLSNVDLYVGESVTLNATITPANATIKTISWSTSNNSVATVSNGVVKALKPGNVTITATSSNGKKVTCKITIKSKTINVSSISLNKETASMYTGDSLTLKATINPSNATDKTVTWISGDDNIATVSNGKVNAKKTGTVAIIATSSNGKQAICTITIKNKPVDVSSIKLNKETANMHVGDSMTLSATITPSNATNKTVTWTSSNSNIATVSNGKVVAKKTGSVTITATSSNGKKATCTINVTNKIVNVTNVKLNKETANMYVGDSMTLSATVSPSNATNKTVTWTSSNSNIATVSNGKVVAKKDGFVVISAVSDNNIVDTCTITIKQKTVDVTSVSLNKKEADMYTGSTLKLTATVSPSNATNKTITWTSSNQGVATVSNGVVTALKPGKVVITATSNNLKQASITISVTNKTVDVSSVSISSTKSSMYVGDNITLTASVKPENSTSKTITWKSSNNEIATVSNGVVTAKKTGTVVITAVSNNKKEASCTITITNRPVDITAVTLNKNFASLTIGETDTLTATVSPSNATNKTITWTSSNSNVATVSNGKVTAVNGGTAIITASAYNGVSASYTVSVRYRAATTSEMRASFGQLVDKPGAGYYVYAPSVMVEGTTFYIYSCSNKDEYQTHDHIYLNTSTRTMILAPQGGWDGYHICDPSVVKGNFYYNGANYKYALAYLGIEDPNGLGNNIGIALSNSPTSGWVKVGNQAYISSNTKSRWGVGQPSLIFVNGKLIMFYTNDTGVGSGMQVRIINPNNMQIEAAGNLGTANTNWMHNADFAYKDNRLYVAYEGDENNGDIISDTIKIKSAYISDYTNISAYQNLYWEDENVINSSISGQPRNTNAGLFKTQSGELQSRMVAFTAVSSGIGNGHFNYKIYKSDF